MSLGFLFNVEVELGIELFFDPRPMKQVTNSQTDPLGPTHGCYRLLVTGLIILYDVYIDCRYH